MKQWWIAALSAVVLSIAGPVRAQEPAVVPSTGDSPPVAPAAHSVPPGPRLAPDWRTLTPRLADGDERSAMNYRATHTFVISTLGLVAIVVLLVLLIA